MVLVQKLTESKFLFNGQNPFAAHQSYWVEEQEGLRGVIAADAVPRWRWAETI
jgi:hypothetical protein